MKNKTKAAAATTTKANTNKKKNKQTATITTPADLTNKQTTMNQQELKEYKRKTSS